MSRHRVSMVLLAAALCGYRPAAAQSSDAPGRVGRVSDVTGSVSLLLAGDTEWRNASLNYPLTTGDALWADAGARGEIHVGASAVHLAEGTALALDAIEDNLVQLRVAQGAVHIRLRGLSQDDSYEIDTPAGTILLRAAGDYRIDVTPDGQRTTVTVRDGDADVMVGNDTYRVRPGTSVTLTGAASQPMTNDWTVPRDAWEQWADMRDRREDAATAARYVPREMVGYEDLDPYGYWQVDVRYGPTWYPRSVAADWAPYRTGRWEWVQPWGWTWIDEAPWGFAPFHYGRWSHHRGRWGWIPGSIRERPIYAPALVVFVSGSGWSVSLSFGANGGVGWIPLGPEEVYVPWYRASPTYARNINITVVNVTQIDVTRIDINTVRYVNRDVQNAVTVVPRDDFIGSRPVGRRAVRVRPEDLASGRVSATPIAAEAPIQPPGPGSPYRARPDNAGPVRQPPVELPRVANPPRGGRGRGNQPTQEAPPPTAPTPPPDQGQERGRNNPQPPAVPAQPPTQDQDRGRDNRQPPVTPPPAVPAPPPAQDQGRGRANRPPPVTPPTAIPTPPPQDRGRGRQRQPVTPPAAISTPPPPQNQSQGRDRTRPTQGPATAPTPVVTPPPAPATPPAGGRATPTRPTTSPTGRGRATPPDSGRVRATPPDSGRVRATPPDSGRGRATPPDSGRGGKPTRTRPDSGRGGGRP